MEFSIVEEPSFSDAVLKLGGSRRVDAAIEILMEPLSRRPYMFPAVDAGTGNRFRYAVTKPIGKTTPALVVIFTVGDDGIVRLQHVEEADFPYRQL
jgi:hypothetical protein